MDKKNYQEMPRKVLWMLEMKQPRVLSEGGRMAFILFFNSFCRGTSGTTFLIFFVHLLEPLHFKIYC